MAEKLNLNRFKSSGVYTVEIDETANVALTLSTGRLVIGSSKKGPINSVVQINDLRSLLSVYGETDTKLEKNGSYFHRTIEVALRQGPVYALNLLPVQDDDIAYSCDCPVAVTGMRGFSCYCCCYYYCCYCYYCCCYSSCRCLTTNYWSWSC